MSELGWTKYTLPSRGVLYEGRLPGGDVEIRKQTAREQARVMQQGGGIAGKVDAIISSCLRLPDSFKDPKQLLLTDRFAVLLALRTKTFGPIYGFEYRCGSCREQVKTETNIVEDFDEQTPPDDLTEPISVKLPECGQTVHMRFLRGSDEEQVARNARRTKMQSNDAGDPTYLMRLAMQVTEVEELDPAERAKFASLPFRQKWIESLSAGDLCFLEDRMDELEPGINTHIYPECPQCGYVNEMTMPFTAEFFRPRRARSGDR